MIFQSLKIECQQYGSDKGKLLAEISIAGKAATTRLILPDNVGESILSIAKNAIIDAVEQSANDFIFELTTAIPDTFLIEAKH